MEIQTVLEYGYCKLSSVSIMKSTLYLPKTERGKQAEVMP